MQRLLLITLLLYSFLPFGCAQYTVRGDINDVWDEFKGSSAKCALDVTGIQNEELRDPVDLARYYLINAYMALCQEDFPLIKEKIIQMQTLRSAMSPRQKRALERNGFVRLYDNLIVESHRLIDGISIPPDDGSGYTDLNRTGETSTNRFEIDIDQLRPRLPSEMAACMDMNFYYEVLSNNEIVFTIETFSCDLGVVEHPGLNRAQIGSPSYYALIYQLFYDASIKPLVEANPYYKDSVQVTVTGKADGWPVSDPIAYPNNTFQLEAGLEYIHIATNGTTNPSLLRSSITDSVGSNKILALARANAGASGVDIVSNNPVVYQAREFTQKGRNYRGVTIEIRARGLFSTELTNYIQGEVELRRIHKEFLLNNRTFAYND